MMESTINTYNKGLNRDVSPNKYSSESYYDALNVRLVTDEALSSFQITNEKGNSNLFNAPSGYKILGTVQMRQYLIIFTKNTNSVNEDQIWMVEVNENGGIDDLDTGNALNEEDHLIYEEDLGFSLDHRIEAYSNYESPEVGKIYFTDNYNNFRHINVLDPNVSTLPLSALSLVPEVQFGTMDIVEVTDTGSYAAGMVQYAHQYYNLHGAQSSFSSPTGLIHLVKSPETTLESKDYLGSATDTATGKAVRLSISNLDSNFTNVRVVAIHFKTLTGTPTINIVEDREVPPSGTIYITDGGNYSKGEISDIEFSALGSVNFKCKTFDVKDNILFPANIVEEFYDVDETTYWDSRAYRWDSSGNAVLTTSDGTPSLTLSSIASAAAVSETHDCIQTKDSQYTYKYTKNKVDGRTRLGGEGPNIRFYFNVENVVDDENATDPSKLYITNNNGFTNYASPTLHAEKVGYLRDELYRFGIVFRDSYGRKSFVKWIADIKMPAVNESDQRFTYQTFVKSSNDVLIRILSVVFEINNIPASAESFEIVRVKREDFDKTIIAQGIISTINTTETAFSARTPSRRPQPISTISTNKLFNFLSPEINFFKKALPSASVQVIAGGSAVLLDYVMAGNQYRLKVNDQSIQTLRIDPTVITESRVLGPGYSSVYTINGNSYKNYRASGTDLYGYMCTNCVLSLYSTLDTGTLAGTLDAYVNIVRSLSGQYGGQSYSGRLNNTYISCSQVLSGNKITVYGGDTYIGYFDLLYGYFDTTPTGVTEKCEAVDFLFPVETSVNLSLRHDICYTKQPGAQDYTKYLMTEKAGTYTDNTNTDTFVQETDLYLYNSVYSRENDVVSYFSKPLNFSNNKTFDVRVLSSGVKKTNEEIDSWTSFLATNYVDLDGTYGPINRMVTYNRRLYFFQDKAVGWVSVNERSLITPDASGTTLSLGKGGILDQYFYISRHSGSRHQFSVVYSPNGIYYYDAANNRINLLNEERNEPISEIKGLSSYLKSVAITGVKRTDNSLNGVGVHGIYDQRFNRILWTFNDIVSGMAGEFTIGYNELVQCFESFYSFKPRIYFKHDDHIYSTDPLNLHKAYLHNNGSYGMFYDSTYDSEISILVNKDPHRAKIFTNVEYLLNTTPEAAVNFESLQVTNHYQDTGTVLLTSDNSNRRGRVWRITVPRNNYGGDTSSRILGEYSIFKLTWADQQAVSTKFLLGDFITHYFNRSI